LIETGSLTKTGVTIHWIEDFHLIDAIFNLCRATIKAGMMIIIVTNPASMERGFITEQQFEAYTDRMSAIRGPRCVTIDQIYSKLDCF
jgi:D-glycero-D-manno-heptose 1,7-bisphosphate phosphatase